MKKGFFIKLFLFSFLLLILPKEILAQKEGAMWYFGHHAGLDFTRHYPKPLTDGKVNTREGVASISDRDGELLFYTDGRTVWNREHQPMQNGSGLLGNTSSTQSSIIVPKPYSDYSYYIFTVDVIPENETESNGLRWSMVDMLQGGGLGAVVDKNQEVLDLCVEKITAVKHGEEGNENYWIIAHGWKNNRFHVFKLTKTGLSPAPNGLSQQDVGSIHDNIDQNDRVNSGAIGYMKTSPKGDLLALAIEGKKLFELFRFNNLTGEINYIATLPAGDEDSPNEPILAAYGVEFSPTSNFLYGSTRRGGKLYQWNIGELDQTKIRNSVKILNPDMHNIQCGALQLAFNGKIYICFSGESYLGVINSPTQDNCNFSRFGTSLLDNIEGKGGSAYFGLPTFLPDFFRAADFYYENTCQNDLTLFYLSTPWVTKPPKWRIYTMDFDFIDEVNVNQETYEGTYRFTEPGDYWVELILNQSGEDKIQGRQVTIHPLPELSFEDSTTMCSGIPLILDAGDGAFYNWRDNSNISLERYRTIVIPGKYVVNVVHNNGCAITDSTIVVEKPLPEIEEIITTKASCGYNNGTITVIPAGDLADYTFDWKQYPDSTGNRLTNLSRGVYEVDVISAETGCPKSEKITISETGAPDIVIHPSVDGTICPGSEITLTAEGAGNYMWTYPEGDTTASITLKPYETDTYVVEGYSTDNLGNRCSGFMDITVEVHPYDPPALGPDLSLCDGEEKELDGLSRFESWEWSNGESGRYVTLTETTPELVLMATDSYGCVSSDTINVEFKPLPEVDLGRDRTLCKGLDVLLDAGIADQYLWNTGDTTQTLNVPASGSYSVLVTLNGCSSSDDVIVRINDPDSLRVDSVQTTDVTCFGSRNGEIRVFARGEGSFYEYSLDEGFTWEDNYGFFESLAPGQHSITVREDSACITEWPNAVEILEPDELTVDYKLISPSCDNCSDGQISLVLTGGNPPYDILWSNFETGKSRTNLALGNYSVSVSDSLNCKTLVTIPLEMGHGSLSIPNAFTPNGDGKNDEWRVTALEPYKDCVVSIFNQAGQLVFESDPGYPEPWKGILDGEYLPTGTYYYVIKLNDLLDLVTGSITLIR